MSTYDNIIQEGRKQGFKQGIELGIELGKKQGFVIGLIRSTDFDDEKISHIVGTTLDYVARIRAKEAVTGGTALHAVRTEPFTAL